MTDRPHQLSVSDELWDLYGGSGMEMRNALWKGRIQAASPVPEDPPTNALGTQPWGTLFISRKLSACPLCHAQIQPRQEAVQTSWTRKTAEGVGRGASGAVHVECAGHNGISVRWSVERMLGDLRKSIETIPNRRLNRPQATSTARVSRPRRDTRYDHLSERERREAIRESNQRAGGDYYGG